MLDRDLLLLFLPFAVLLVLTPGADTMSVLTLSLRKGRAAGLRSIAGHATSSLVHIAAAALGLSAIIATSAVAFSTVKLLGAVYLLHLGAKTFAGPKPALEGGEAHLLDDARGDFWQGFVTHVSNPKVAVFYLTVLPQFMNPKLGHLGLQAAALGGLHIGMAMVWLGFLSFAAGRARNWLARSDRFWAWQRRLTGTLFIAFGLKLALARQKA